MRVKTWIKKHRDFLLAWVFIQADLISSSAPRTFTVQPPPEIKEAEKGSVGTIGTIGVSCGAQRSSFKPCWDGKTPRIWN